MNITQKDLAMLVNKHANSIKYMKKNNKSMFSLLKKGAESELNTIVDKNKFFNNVMKDFLKSEKLEANDKFSIKTFVDYCKEKNIGLCKLESERKQSEISLIQVFNYVNNKEKTKQNIS